VNHVALDYHAMPQDTKGYLADKTRIIVCDQGGDEVVSERTIIKLIAVIGIALLVIFGYSTIQKAIGQFLPSDANIGIAGMLIVLGVLGYLWISGKAEEVLE
jgi:hypothetical protein